MSKKNKKVILTASALMLVLIGGIGYFCISKTQQKEVVETTTEVADNSVSFTTTSKSGKTKTINTTFDEIENDEKLKKEWEEYKENVVMPSSSEAEQSETIPKENETRLAVNPAFDSNGKEKVDSKFANSSSENGSASDNKCEELLKKSSKYYEEMKSGTRNEDKMFMKCYENLKETHSEKNYKMLKANLFGVAGDD